MRPLPLLPDTGPVQVRHIIPGQAGDAGAVALDNVYLVPQRPDGVNGEQGWQTGSYAPRLSDEGTMLIELPNVIGGDGVAHRDRFRYFTDDDYHAGDEWLELYRNADGGGRTLLFVGTPVKGRLAGGRVSLELTDALAVSNITRDTAAAFWRHAPRDVFEFYCRRWVVALSEGFDVAPRFTYSADTTVRTTADGKLTYRACADDPTHLSAALLNPPASGLAYVRGAEFNVEHSPTAAWRFETVLRLSENAYTAATNWTLIVGMLESGALGGLWVNRNQSDLICNAYGAGGTAGNQKRIRTEGDRDSAITVAIEARNGWAFYYIDGELRAVLPARTTGNLQPVVQISVGAEVVTCHVESILTREALPMLQRAGIGGDLALPGIPARDFGLQGEYFDDHDLFREDPAGKADRTLDPTRQPYQRRLDRHLAFGTGSWEPAGLQGGEHLSARWTGSIYLDLDNYDYALRFDGEDRCRIWIGDTRPGQTYLNDWSSAGHAAPAITTAPWLKTGNAGTGAPGSGTAGKLAGQRSGWYPIVVEFSTDAGAKKLRVEFQRSDAVGTWSGLGKTTSTPGLSPMGIHVAQPRFDGFAEQLKDLAKTYGYQYVVEPRQLESGEFPGRCVPVKRVGRDTAKVIDRLEGVEPVNESTADEVIDTLLADAAGLSDEGDAQLTHEAIDFGALAIPRFAVASAYESLADITFRRLLETRAANLLALRKRPWEDVSVRVPGKRELMDLFPLTGLIANLREFDHGPGDGVRLDFPEIRVKDATPRQISAVTWPIRPRGLGAPALSFRSRPRSLRESLRALSRRAVLSDRNYQGQKTERTGNVAGNAASGLTDQYARVGLPENLNDVRKATFIVHQKDDASAMTIEVNGVATTLAVTGVGPVDLTPYIARSTFLGPEPRMYVRLTGGTAGAQYQLVIRIRI